MRKPGSVGLAAGPRSRSWTRRDASSAAGETGEIVIRGDNVTAGYENNPKANAEAFTNGWFRTGDQGVIDADGYLTLTGRLKEIINRGGEKISPREVDEVLMDHPGRAAGGDLRRPASTSSARTSARRWSCARALTRHRAGTARRSLVRTARGVQDAAQNPFPRRDPQGATGKLQRIGLAQKLGLERDAAN